MKLLINIQSVNMDCLIGFIFSIDCNIRNIFTSHQANYRETSLFENSSVSCIKRSPICTTFASILFHRAFSIQKFSLVSHGSDASCNKELNQTLGDPN